MIVQLGLCHLGGNSEDSFSRDAAHLAGAYQKGGNHTVTLLHLGGSYVVKRVDNIIG